MLLMNTVMLISYSYVQTWGREIQQNHWPWTHTQNDAVYAKLQIKSIVSVLYHNRHAIYECRFDQQFHLMLLNKSKKPLSWSYSLHSHIHLKFTYMYLHGLNVKTHPLSAWLLVYVIFVFDINLIAN